MKPQNEMSIQFSAISENESFARVAVAAFISQLNPTMEELTEVKTVVSEAVTNAIIHGYAENSGDVYLRCKIMGYTMELTIEDHGKGMEDIDEARQPLFTTRPDLERSGMGFTIMESFMDEMTIESAPNRGTLVHMKKIIRAPHGAARFEV
ncbi:anti-sigma F factor [Ferroacidibacillus organovorans]|uniref:Anti-sigma F factor n=1 Tax=Ferroacidibacillus organovorans TaxID=1765683 RepID=A0A101XQW6_9BACL|nr:anti-sigma F factor [Ferroacidibacillus organovorans]KUO95878.1 anti-sigma F factor [Ferroacidibacillus organovorans]